MKQRLQRYRWFIVCVYTGVVLLFCFQNSSARLTITKTSHIKGNSGNPVTYSITNNNLTGGSFVPSVGCFKVRVTSSITITTLPAA